MAREIMNLLVNRIMDREIERAASSYLSGRLIDIGCGKKPYREMLSRYVACHIGVDHAESLHGVDDADLIGSAYAIPSPDQSFDCAISTAVLEHLEEPESALLECHRVLVDDGIAVYTVPFIWHLHEEPRDFYRFTKHGLRYLFTKAGFDLVEIRALSGFWVTFCQLFVYYLYEFHRGPMRLVPIIPALGLMVQGFGNVMDKLSRREQWTWMYLVVARKHSGK